MENHFRNIKKIHFIGIGGIGVSALARMMLLEKKKVSSSDITPSLVTERMERLGAKVHIGHKEKNLPKEVDIVVYSPAVQGSNPELMAARARGVPTYSYPEALGLISKGKYTIAVSGTHGKTTTTAMIAEILIDAKKSPTVVIGSFLKKEKDNFVAGKSDVFVVEACEYRRSFLNLSPKILVITNIDADHLDYYGNLAGVQKGFAEMVAKVPKNGFIVCDPGNTKVKPAIEKTKARIIDYTKEKLVVTLPVSGEHNRENARAALAVARLASVDTKKAGESLAHFHGTWRRMEYKGKTRRGVIVYDDYGHHPTEVRRTLQGFRERHKKDRIIVVFQPHLYSRTKLLLKDFAKGFGAVDEAVIADIYAAREVDDGTIHARDLAAKIGKNARYIGGSGAISAYLEKHLKKGNILITMGAGDVHKVGDGLLRR
ncbi:MAG: Mur ligase domain-containing protein [Patescibacteria group bacterium]